MTTISTKAQIAIRSLLAGDAEKVNRFIESMDSFNLQQAKKLESNELVDTYIAPIDDRLRIIFRRTQKEIEVLDIVMKQTLVNIFNPVPE